MEFKIKVFFVYLLLIHMNILFNCYALVQETNLSVKEYCIRENLIADCDINEVVMMQHAVYGRMKVGKCMKRDYFLGCSVNVLGVVDSLCSGQQSCDIPVFNDEMDDMAYCLEDDLSAYLEAAYYCQKIYVPRNKICHSPEKIHVILEEMYVASKSALDTSCGLHGSPWILDALPGQNVDISLKDFSWTNDSLNTHECPTNYGYILDMESDDVISICGGKKREKHLYQSIGNTLQIILEKNALENHRFILKFNAVGCPDFKPPHHSWVQKENDSLIVGCMSSDTTWRLTCVDNRWLGIVGNCTKPPRNKEVQEPVIVSVNKNHVVKKDSALQVPPISNNHVIIFTMACLTLLTCCVIIILGVYCTKRYDVKLKKYKTHCNSTTLYKDGRLTLASSAAMSTYRPMTSIPMSTMNTGGMHPPAYTFPKPLEPNRGPAVPPRNEIKQDDSNAKSQAYENVSNIGNEEAEPVHYFVLENPAEFM